MGRLQQREDGIDVILSIIITELEETMTTVQDLSDKVDQLLADQATLIADLQEDLATAQGQIPDPTVLDGIAAKLDTADEATQAAIAAQAPAAGTTGGTTAPAGATDPTGAGTDPAPVDTGTGTPAPVDTGTDPAPVDTGTDPTGVDPPAPAPTDPSNTPTPAPVVAQPSLYTVDAGNTVDPAQWTETSSTTPEGLPLYTYAGDAEPGQANGDGIGGVFHLYTGTVIAAGASA